MTKKFIKRNSQFFLMLFIGVIAVSFMFTGYENMTGVPDVVATVGDLPIKTNEYQNEYNRQLSLYRNFTNNKALTAQQIKQFRINENVMNNLVEHRLWVKLAQDNDLGVSEKEIVDKIKEQSWFLTDKKFDFEKYKYLLQANGMTTAYYEKLTGHDTLNGLSRQIFSHYPISKGHMEKLSHYKNQKITAHAVEIQKNSLKKHLKVSKRETKNFLKDPKNLKKVEELFKKRQSNKKDKLEAQKFALAKELIQNSPDKAKALDALADQLSQRLKKLLKGNKIKQIESLKKKYGLKMDKNISIDRFNGSKGAVKIAEKDISSVFKDGLLNRRSYLFKDGSKWILLRAFPYKAPKGKKKDSKALAEKQKSEQRTAQYSFQNKLSRSIIDDFKKDVSIKIYKNTSSL